MLEKGNGHGMTFGETHRLYLVAKGIFDIVIVI